MTAWKLGTFAIGLVWLLYGAAFFDYPDWDYGVSLLMALSTLLTAEWVVSTWMDRGRKRLSLRFVLLASLAIWWAVDGSYTLYWSLVNPDVMIREGQWPMSLCLYLLAGFTWRADPSAVLALLRRLASRPSLDRS
jgi:hypothetical protein